VQRLHTGAMHTISSGERVPDVITIERYFFITGASANDASRQLVFEQQHSVNSNTSYTKNPGVAACDT
jgi:hypothetical protein